MARPVFRPIIFALKRAPTWPGLALAPEWGDPVPDGYEFVYDTYGILKYANDGSPYISNGTEMISFYEYEARQSEPPVDPLPPIPGDAYFLNGDDAQYLLGADGEYLYGNEA